VFISWIEEERLTLFFKVVFTPDSLDVISLKGKTLTLQCEVNKPKGDVQWLKDGKEMTPSRRCTIRAQGRERSLTIQQLTDKDAGEYVCESTDDQTAATVRIDLQAIQNMFITFFCFVSQEAAEVQWMRQGILIHPGAKYTLKHRGRSHSLTIHQVAAADRGAYSCETLHDRTQAQLAVERECSRVLTMSCCCLFTTVTDNSPCF
uniref:Ig-like domain-containing protein n=1 Tax=Poecilia mexicana TaxID=48701 RepID=A0A3B3YH47_9TELE